MRMYDDLARSEVCLIFFVAIGARGFNFSGDPFLSSCLTLGFPNASFSERACILQFLQL